MTDITNTCDRCSAPVPAGSNTCPSCGAPLTETAASGFETTKLDDIFSTTKLDTTANGLLQEPFAKDPIPQESAENPEPITAEPTVSTSPLSDSSFTPLSPLEKVSTSKEWYKNPLVWVIGCVVLFICCACTGVIAALIALLPIGL